MSGRMMASLMAAAAAAPNPAAMSAIRLKTPSSFQLGFTLIDRVVAADSVPQKDANLLVDNAVAGTIAGKAAMTSGSITRPPPPMTPSIHPAKTEPPASTAHVAVEMCMEFIKVVSHSYNQSEINKTPGMR